MKILKSDVPELFTDIREVIIDESFNEHRRGSTFFVKSVVEFREEHAEFYPGVPNFKDYVGTWETNQYITSEDDTDWDEIIELTKVEKKEVTKTVTTTEWVEIR